MNREPRRSRLIRAGTVRDVRGGCTSIEVSVPCSTCRLGCTGARHLKGRLQLPERPNAADLRLGDPVMITVDASGLTRASLLLFGPVVVWALCAAALPVAGWAGATGIGAGLALSLMVGWQLVHGRRDRAGNLLDVRAEVAEGPVREFES